MAWAIFTKEFNWDRPKSTLCFNVQPSELPQEKPQDVVDAAVTAGFAEAVASPTKTAKKELAAKAAE